MNFQAVMEDILVRLQNAEIVEDEGEFIQLSPEDIAASQDELRRSCIGKLLADRELNINALRRCLQRAWQWSDFKIAKLDSCVFQVYFEELESTQAVVNGGPWNVEDHLLLLKPWKENFSLFDKNLFQVDFWIQIWGLPAERYSECVGKKLLSSLRCNFDNNGEHGKNSIVVE